MLCRELMKYVDDIVDIISIKKDFERIGVIALKMGFEQSWSLGNV